MKRVIFFIMMTVQCSTALVRAAVIYSNFGANDSFDTTSGLTIHGPSDPSQFREWALLFTPTSDYYLESVTLAISHTSGQNLMTIKIARMNESAPGEILEETTFIASSSPEIVRLTFSGSTVLTQGVDYALWVSVAGDGEAQWYLNNIYDFSWHNCLYRDAASWHFYSSGDRAVFRIEGSAALGAAIYSNFRSSGGFDDSFGWDVTGPSSPERLHMYAALFMPPADYYLASATIAVSHAAGQNLVNVKITAWGQSMPGEVLAEGSCVASALPELVRIDFSGVTVLRKNETYALWLSVPGDGEIDWYTNDINDWPRDNLFVGLGYGWFGWVGIPRPVFSVAGTAITPKAPAAEGVGLGLLMGLMSCILCLSNYRRH